MLVTSYCFSSRDDDSEVRRGSLSNEFRRMSRQRISVNIYISFLSWVLEFIVGFLWISLVIAQYIFWEDVDFVHRWHRLLDASMLIIILPCSYIINSEKTKEIIVLQNWYQGIRSIFLPNIQVAPAGEPDPPAQPRNNSAFARNVDSNEEPPERISGEDIINEEPPDPQISPRISDHPSETQPSAISSNHLNSSDTFINQVPKNEIIPLSNIRLIQVESTRK